MLHYAQTTREVMLLKVFQARATLLLIFGLFFFSHLSHADYKATINDFEYFLSNTLKPETYYGKNISLLNNDNTLDRIYYSRHTLDTTFDVLYGKQSYGDVVGECFVQFRNKATWGNSGTNAVTEDADTKTLETVARPHKHNFPRHIFWIRQLFLDFDLGQALGLPFKNKHSLKLGAFPFQLGRGIALGDAYAIGQEALGFYSASAVDQYAFGLLFSGDLVADVLAYNLYTAILNNKSGTLSDTGAKILGQEFGRLTTPARGFGKINFVVAGRFLWNVFDNNHLGRLTVEPYAMFNSDPEQKVEFFADASSKLGSIGMASEFYGDKVEFGFDYAFNFGRQKVKGWDRNQIEQRNRNGQVVLVNTHVTTDTTVQVGGAPTTVTENLPYVLGSDAQAFVDKAFRDESRNGKEIGTVASAGYLPGNQFTLKNANNRFRNPNTNKFEGWMFVADAAYMMLDRDLQLAVTVGVASGDDNPNLETKDGEYSGFIGLQELYSGKRVRSVFLFGGAGKLNQRLSTPTADQVQAPSPFAQTVSGFTNLVFFGSSLKWTPHKWKKYFEFNPNIITFFQEKPIGRARTYLGTEIGLFVYYNLLKNMKLSFVSSIFFPGTHYKDRMGVPLTLEQQETLDEPDTTGFEQDRIPNLGNDIAYTFNIGLTYSF